MWTVLTYAYNSILILFIATHLLVGAIISFTVGLYMGVYLCQNYEVPRITEPSKLWEKFVAFMEEHRLNNPSKSFHHILKPTTILSIVKASDSSINDSCDTFAYQTAEGVTNNTQYTSGRGRGTPTLLGEPVEEETDNRGLVRRSSSQILEASLIISTDAV